MKRFRSLLVVLLALAALIGIETVAHRRVDPSGRASTLGEYLVWRPREQRFARIESDGRSHIIAYGPVSSWLLLSSGPSAYVFDEAGRLVDWSADIGDDPHFDTRWNAQGARSALKRGEVERLAASTRPT